MIDFLNPSFAIELRKSLSIFYLCFCKELLRSTNLFFFSLILWILNLKFTYEVNLIIHSFTISSGKQDLNLRPPASKAGKQPPLSFQFADSLQNSFPRDSRSGNFSVNLYDRLEWIVNSHFALQSIFNSLTK